MIEFILEYLGMNNAYPLNDEEQRAIEEGIRLYLSENGISENDTGYYYKQYILRHIQIISKGDLKNYFEKYSYISRVNQIIIEYNHDGTITEEKIIELRKLITVLFESRLNLYIPADEVRQILG